MDRVEFVFVNSGSGQGLGIKIFIWGLMSDGDHSIFQKLTLSPLVGRKLQMTGQCKGDFSIEVTVKFGDSINN